MSTTFLINDASTGGNNPTVQVTITENANGTLTFTVTQLVSAGAYLGDLRGLFFDVADEDLIGTLSGTSLSDPLTEFQQGDDTVKDLGQGANMQGLLGDSGGYDVGIEIGTQGIGTDDVRTFSFTLESTARALTLADFANVDFGVRITSVGQDIGGDGIIDTSRSGSSKILENNDVGAAVTFAVTVTSETPVNDSSASVTISEADSTDDTGTFTITQGGDALAGTNTASVTIGVTGTATDPDFFSGLGTDNEADLTDAILEAIAAAANAALGGGSAVINYDLDTVTATWNEGDPASFNVALTAVNDGLAESPEVLSLTLSDATIVEGTAIITTASATLDIFG